MNLELIEYKPEPECCRANASKNRSLIWRATTGIVQSVQFRVDSQGPCETFAFVRFVRFETRQAGDRRRLKYGFRDTDDTPYNPRQRLRRVLTFRSFLWLTNGAGGTLILAASFLCHRCFGKRHFEPVLK